MARFLLRTLAVLIVLPALGLLGIATPWGAAQLAKVAMWAVPGLTIEGLGGPLPSRLTLARATLADADGPWLLLEDVAIDPEWSALLRGEAHLRQLRAARVQLLRLPPGEPAPAPTTPEPFTMPGLPQLPLALRLDQVAVARLELGASVLGNAVTLALEGEARLAGDGGTARLAVTRLDAPGSLRLDALLRDGALTAHLDVAEPPGGVLAMLAGRPDAAFDARSRIEDARWTLAASLGDSAAEGEGTLSLAGGLALAGQIQARPGAFLPPAIAPLASQVTLGLALRQAPDTAWQVERIALATPAGRLTGSLRLGAAGALTGTLRVDPAGPDTFATLLPEGLGWAAAGLDARLGGTLDAPWIEIDGAIDGPRTGTALDPMLGERLTVQARAGQGGRAVRLALGAARIEFAAEGSAIGELGLDIRAAVVNPPGAVGRVTLEGRVTGAAAAPSARVVLASERLTGAGRVLEALRLTLDASITEIHAQAEGRLDAEPLALRFDAALVDSRVRISGLDATWAGATLRGAAEGPPSGPYAGALDLNLPDLARFSPGLAGRVTLAARAEALPGATGPAAQGLSLRVESPGLRVAGQQARLALDATGTLAQADLRLSAATPQAAIETTARLAMSDGAIEAAINRLDLRGGAESLALQGGARLRREANGDLTLAPARFASPRGGRLTIQAQTRGEALTARAELQALPIAPFSAGAAEGTLSGEVTATGPIANPDARFTLRGTGLRAAAAPGLPLAQLTATGSASASAARVPSHSQREK